jgi:hypothetical protein
VMNKLSGITARLRGINTQREPTGRATFVAGQGRNLSAAVRACL